MKRKAEPAFVEDLSSETNDTIPDTRRTASRRTASRPNIPQARESPKRKKTIDRVGRSRTKSAQSAVVCHSRNRGPLFQAVREYDGTVPMTMLSGATDQSAARNEVSGCCIRKFFYEDRPVSNETSTFIERDIFMSKGDSEHTNPSIWIEQRTNESGKETTTAQELFFLERLVDGKVYIFKECGDHILGEGKLPDLHFTARVLPPAEWSEYTKTAKYYGYDRHIEVRPTRMDLKDGKAFSYDLNKDLGVSCSGIEVSSRKLPGQSSLGQDSYIVTIKLQGLGTLSEDDFTRGDLKLKICID